MAGSDLPELVKSISRDSSSLSQHLHPFRKESTDLVHRVSRLSHLFDEIPLRHSDSWYSDLLLSLQSVRCLLLSLPNSPSSVSPTPPPSPLHGNVVSAIAFFCAQLTSPVDLLVGVPNGAFLRLNFLF
ncbi:hypothetical protein MLD38_004429 [Melastoma candidum]|uniref:Uncharacterized protein n=1 Tax=Melastoma candidum TaxID=119954 RepID=A0ACB9S5P3_9MYRT|nr:hypothetical protein MLD38_004429 [Melastoma candidum]